jgi:outer membrane immunogenic protein
MKLRSTLIGVALASGAVLASANASDLYPAPSGAGGYKDAYMPADTWAGVYAGVNAGGAWGRDSVSPTIPDGGPFPRTERLSSDGGFGGGALGYNFQRGNAVFGVEMDLGYLGIGKSRIDVPGFPEVDHISSGLYGDVTGRLGYAFDRILVYGKGGFAFYDAQAETTTSVPGFMPTSTKTLTGWTAGAGAEYKVNPAWSVKAEYLHFDFGSETATLEGGFGYKNSVEVNTVKFGVNYHPFSVYEPLK